MTAERRYPRWIGLILSLAAMLVILSIPFLAAGWYLEPQIEAAVIASRERPLVVGLVGTAVLAADIFLPVPSSFVCTTLGQILGLPLAALACTVGLQCGAIIGWYAGRRLGDPWLQACCGREISGLGKEFLDAWGIWAIFLSRPIPLVAEAITLLLGTHPAPFAKWFPSLLLSNASLALAWCSLGTWSQQKHMLWLASIISVVAPLALLLGVHAWRRTSKHLK